MLVSIIIPAYKQEKSILKDIENIHNTMSQTRWDFELIVVVDGNVDATMQNAKKIRKSNVKIVGYKTNRGKGYAVRYGMARSSGDYIAFIDSGMDINPNGISMLLEHMQWYSADVIVGSKRHPASKVTNYPFMRRMYTWGYHILVKLLFNLPIKDTQAGLKVYRRAVLEKVLPRLVVKAFAFDVELLAVAKKLGFSRMYEAPIELKLEFGASHSKFSPYMFLNKAVRDMFLDTIAVFYRMNFLRYYDDGSKRSWVFDKELEMRLNTGEMENSNLAQLSISKKIQKELSSIDEPFKFSIIIPVRAINSYLRENIYHLRKLNYKNFEVLIILDEKEEYNFEGDFRFKLLTVGNKGPGEKRNIGAKSSTGDILVFLDDDAFPSNTWLDHAAAIFEKNDIYALGAPAVTPPNAGFFERVSGRVMESRLASHDTVYRHTPLASRLIDDYPTVNLFVRKEAFVKVGGFNENFWPGEDTKLCLDLVAYFNRKFLYDPHPIVYHHRRMIFTPHLKQVSRYGRHRGHFAKIFPDNSRVLWYFIPSFFVLGLALGPLFSFIFPPLWLVYFVVLYVYFFFLVNEVIKAMLYDKSILSGLLVGVSIFLTHVVYGANFLIGFLRRPRLNLKKFDLVSGNYTEG
jgi:glycosyltransferase involved in cell wall biosynthesis